MAIIMTMLIVGFVSLLLVFLWTTFLLPLSRTLPPGPRPLPILGNLLLMMKYPSVHDFANELKLKYGPIVTLWMGSEPFVIISGPEVIHEAMITQGGIFMGRSRLQSTRIVTSGHRTVFTGHGERHRFLRKLVVSEILSNKKLAGFRGIREKEVIILIETLRKKSRDSGGGVVTDFRSVIRLTICNMLVSLLFGGRLTTDEAVELEEVMLQRLQMGSGKPRDFISFLTWLPDRKGDTIQMELMEKASKIFEPLIKERKQTLKSGRSEQTTFLDTLLGLQSGDIKSSIQISDSDIVANCLDLLVAGTDTTALNLEYCIANLINHPDIQEKPSQEISTIVGERLVDEDDMPRLPYLQAVVKESLRRHSPARLSPARRALLPTKLAGYEIPENTTVVQHLEAVALSPQIWDDPLEFNPERFVNKNVDITGSTDISLIPFGVGRRICPGINIALLHAQLILGRLIQAFEWNSATPGQLLDLSPASGPSSPMKYPLVASVQKRLIVSSISTHIVYILRCLSY